MLEFTDKVVGTAIIEKPLTENDIENIIVNALEGGSNYWVGVDNTGELWEGKPKDEPVSTWATKLIIDGKSVKLFDIEEEADDSEWTITLDKLLKGYAQNCKERPHDCDLENSDAVTVDCILQYALFEELVYG